MEKNRSLSFNRCYLQARLVTTKKYTELSSDIEGKEYRPDICLYPMRKANYWRDIVKMKELPLLAIEILSMSQTIQELTSMRDF